MSHSVSQKRMVILILLEIFQLFSCIKKKFKILTKFLQKLVHRHGRDNHRLKTFAVDDFDSLKKMAKQLEIL